MTALTQQRGLLLLICALALATGGHSAFAQDATTATIAGRLVDGTESAEFDPTQVAVTLNVFEGVTSFDPVSVRPAADGTFTFEVTPSPDRVYFMSAEYQGATYSASVAADDLGKPVDLTVYEATQDVSVLRIESYSVIVTGVVPGERWVEVLERASVFNDSGRTLVPDLAAQGPAMLNFLRFALPNGAYNLDVRSTVVGGDILTVDRGFAMTTPIPPTGEDPHLVEFVYRVPYDGDVLDLSRTMRFGADAFRYVVPAEVGRPASSGLNDLGATELNGRFLRLLEGQDIQPGQAVDISITELPQPTLWDQAGDVAGDWYVRYVVPAFVVATLALFALVMYRRRALVPAVGSSENVTVARGRLLERLAELDRRKAEGRLSPRSYDAARNQIREALIDLRIRETGGEAQRTS